VHDEIEQAPYFRTKAVTLNGGRCLGIGHLVPHNVGAAAIFGAQAEKSTAARYSEKGCSFLTKRTAKRLSGGLRAGWSSHAPGDDGAGAKVFLLLFSKKDFSFQYCLTLCAGKRAAICTGMAR
jgi:hypothetical protein